MPSKLNIQKLQDEFEKFYLDYGQNRSKLIRSLTQPAVTLEQYARRINTRETVFRLANYDFGSLIQPFSTKFEPISDITFYPNETLLAEMKINVSITPHDIEEGYIGFLAGDETRTLKDWPVVRWLMEEYLVKQIAEDKELKMVYKGKKVLGGKTPESCMDGIKEKLIKGATADYPINIITGIGPLSEASIFDKIESFDKQIPDLYNKKRVVLYMAPKWVRAYKTAKRANGFYTIFSEKNIDETIDFSNHLLVGLPSMAGTDDIWASVDNNLLWLAKRESALSQSSIQLHHYNVDILLDWWEAVGFACNQMVWCTEETLNPLPVVTPPETSESGS